MLVQDEKQLELDFTLKSPDSTSCPLTSSRRLCVLARRRLSLSPTIPPSFLVVVLSSAIIIIPLASTSLFSSASSFPASLSFFLLVAIDSTFALYRVLVCSHHKE
ncbi:hypothetical protein BDY19DRAFT_995887 [Irpex rosettiformis]|uniref:Uncharacterized protein n=1 Tax=Irpex rosettiformis TaxID=378272 RepID=A0ACB8TX69_9APHY|nr:hypothetical protein BDY19DRAFT_995887 [Irpex rosettiformis]